MDYCGDSRPAGDDSREFFDFAPAEDSALMVALGGVLGQGMPASILLSGMRAWLRVLGGAASGVLTAAIEQLNRLVYEVAPENLYGELFCARVDPIERRLDYVNAGHEPALLVRGDRVFTLENTGTLLGLTSRAHHRQRSLPLEAGDLLLAFSDGICTACHGESGVLRLVRENPYARAADLVSRIMQLVGRNPVVGDSTVAAVRFNTAIEVPLSAEMALAAA